MKYSSRLKNFGIIIACVASFFISTGHASASGTPAVVKNIKTDFGAVCNGVANDVQAFTDFHEWALAWQQTHTGLIELDIPSGSVCEFITSAGVMGLTGDNFSGRFFAMNIKQLLVVGYGASLNDNNGTGAGFFLGGAGQYGDNFHNARTESVSAGATSITLKNPSQTSIFSVGAYALMTGLDMMGYGYPTNPYYFQYVKITNINAGTGVVTFDAPLKDSYSSTWPMYWSGSAYQTDLGGPATLYALDPSWDGEVEYDGLTFSMAYQIYSNERSVTFKDASFTNGCAIPTQNLTWTVINSTMPCWIEVDKLVDTIKITNSTVRAIEFQSSSINLFQTDGSTYYVINGTPKKAVISNSTIENFRPGTTGYGKTDEVVCTNCVINSFSLGGVQEGNTGSSVTSYMSISNGTITVPLGQGPQRWAVPGTNAFFIGPYDGEVPFTVTDVTADATNAYIHTTLTGGWPPTPLWYQGTALNIHVHPAPKFTCTNCTGTPEVVSFSQAPPATPVYSYSKRSYSGNFGNSGFYIWGKVVSIKVNVTKPYTGSKTSVDLSLMGPYGANVINPDLTLSRPIPSINTKIAGERIITPSGVVGAQSGDNVTNPWNIWITQIGIYLPDLSTENPSTWPQVTVEVITDQGTGFFSSSPSPTPPPPPPVVTYTLTASAGLGGTISPLGTTTLNQAANQLYVVSPNLGYSIGSVTIDGVNQGSITSYTFTNISTNHTILVTFNLIPVTPPTSITYTLNTTTANGSISKNPNKATYNQGEIVTLTAVANTGYAFSSWSGDALGSTNSITLTMAANKTVIANFLLVSVSPLPLNSIPTSTQFTYFSPGSTYSLLIGTNGNFGTVDRSPFQMFYTKDQQVTLTAKPDTRFGATYVFKGWSGDLTGISNPASITVSKDMRIIANFGVQGVDDVNLTSPTTTNTTTPDSTPSTSVKTAGAAIVGVPASFVFSQSLTLGTNSTEVQYLQMVLNSDPATRVATVGWGSPGHESIHFGPATRAAIIKFQNKYASEILYPKFQIGTGVVGLATRKKLNGLLGR